MKIKIKKAKEKDIGRIIESAHPMWLQHADEEPQFLSRNYLKNYNVKTYFQKCFDQPDRNALFVAKKREKIVGMIRVEVIKLDGMFTSNKAVYLDDLVVDKEYRKQGIAKRLLGEAINFAKKKNVKLMKVRIYQFNQVAQKLFTKNGFTNLYSEYYKKLS